MYTAMAKGTSWAEVTSNSKKIKPLLSYASLKASGRELVRELVSQLVENFIKYFLIP